jgi:DNA-binding HxlR family transcriptional regulator
VSEKSPFRKPTIPPPAACAISGLLEVLAKPWTLHILWVLSHEGPTRFGALRRKVNGISSRMLSERLRLLAQEGFVTRHYEPTIPPAVTYELTARSAEINKVLEALEKLAQGWEREDAQDARPASVGADSRSQEESLP